MLQVLSRRAVRIARCSRVDEADEHGEKEAMLATQRQCKMYEGTDSGSGESRRQKQPHYERRGREHIRSLQAKKVEKENAPDEELVIWYAACLLVSAVMHMSISFTMVLREHEQLLLPSTLPIEDADPPAQAQENDNGLGMAGRE